MMIINDDTNLYTSLIPDNKFSSALNSFIQSNRDIAKYIPKDFITFMPKEDYHCTLVFTKHNGMIIRQEVIELLYGCNILVDIKAEFKEFAILGNYLVLKIDSPQLQEVFTHLREIGATWDFPSYLPHISVAKLSDTTSKYAIVLETLMNTAKFNYFDKIGFSGTVIEDLKD